MRRDTGAIAILSAASLFRFLLRLAKQTKREISATNTIKVTIMAVIKAEDSKEKERDKSQTSRVI